MGGCHRNSQWLAILRRGLPLRPLRGTGEDAEVMRSTTSTRVTPENAMVGSMLCRSTKTVVFWRGRAWHSFDVSYGFMTYQ
jgi:hypothetical protein